ncbi:MAG TPA: hypothetical protein EYP85_15605 [Armatimonadetes bacterium]|nr:hypothetical protein [Armatimonadota bacterium]
MKGHRCNLIPIFLAVLAGGFSLPKWCQMSSCAAEGRAKAAVSLRLRTAPWQWTEEWPFRDLQVRVSSEDPQWPASRIIDGDTSEPAGLWQTERNNPREATVELILREPRKIDNVRIYHQQNPRYYRSLDYTISVRVGNEWREVAAVRDNRQSGWRDHPFLPLLTDRVRVHITRSEYGYRMGLNEIELHFVGEPRGGSFSRRSAPHYCGRPVDLGLIEWEATTPPGTAVRLRTRTAPDAGGRPGRWSAWSPYYPHRGARIVSPRGAWIQYEARFDSQNEQLPCLRFVRLGAPQTVHDLTVNAYLLRPGEEVSLAVLFDRPMDTRSRLLAHLEFSGPSRRSLRLRGRWEEGGRRWRAEPVRIPPGETATEVFLSARGARTREGVVMWPYRQRLLLSKAALVEYLRDLCAWMMAHPSPAIFIEGYNERTILGAYEILGEERYLEHAKRWAEHLLASQKKKGYWGTGYQDVYFADTGSALGLLINLYKHLGEADRQRVITALRRYFHLLLEEGDTQGRSFLHEDGSLGVGFYTDREGNVTGDIWGSYTISTALTGAGIASAMYYLVGEEKFKTMALGALRWIFSTMRADGQIPYIIDDWNPGRKDQTYLWERWPYDTSAYVGEGVIAAWTYIDDPAARREIEQSIKPHIEWLLRTQNPDGSWAKPGSGDQLRSHGVVNLLLWYYHHVQADEPIANALRKYYLCLLDPQRARPLRVKQNAIATALVGRAVVETIRPGTDCRRWKEEAK